MHRCTRVFLRMILGVMAVGLTAGRSIAGPPAYDHIVVVIEENKSLTQVIGSGQAPYLDSLAAGGTLLTGVYGITHPSQPNYLQLFSGSNQGVVDNNDAAGAPFSTPNLGAAVESVGGSFVGYSETMPSVGYIDHDAAGGLYARRHNPWVNWQSDSPTGNQLAPETNQPFSSFPDSSNFDSLPSVSFVVPNNANNMHDGTISAGSAWVETNLSAYASWATTHNSLLIVTFDEDNSIARNNVTTILYGADVKTGAVVNSTWTSHNILRTIEDSFGAPHSGAAADVRPIVGAFTTDPMTATVTFRQGANGYLGAHDTFLEAANPTANHAADSTMVVDGSPNSQGLIRFDNLFGDGPGQIPVGATILSAKLSFLTGVLANDLSQDQMSLIPMLTSWNDSSTFASLVNGVDGAEASSNSDFTLTPNTGLTYGIFDVSNTLQAWANGAINYGWLIQATGTDGWRFSSSEAGTVGDRPTLEVTYVVPEASPWLFAALGAAIAAVARGRRRGRR